MIWKMYLRDKKCFESLPLGPSVWYMGSAKTPFYLSKFFRPRAPSFIGEVVMYDYLCKKGTTFVMTIRKNILPSFLLYLFLIKTMTKEKLTLKSRSIQLNPTRIVIRRLRYHRCTDNASYHTRQSVWRVSTYYHYEAIGSKRFVWKVWLKFFFLSRKSWYLNILLQYCCTWIPTMQSSKQPL